MVMKTPGVYIVEKSAFPNSVVQVATAVPAFIGYTEKAMNGNVSLHEEPFRITSMTEYLNYFGGAPKPQFDIAPFAQREGASFLDEDGDMLAPELPQAVFTVNGPRGPAKYELKQKGPAFNLYAAMRIFFQNGGGACYVTSIGTYDGGEIDSQKMIDALRRLEKEPEPTMVVIPETTRLVRQNAIKVQQQMLIHCGTKMKSRFAILDITGGDLPQNGPRGKPVEMFRSKLGTTNLDYGAAYYPWLHSSVYQSRDFTFENIAFDSRKKFISLLKNNVNQDAELKPEIDRVGTPMLTGDFTISVEYKGTATLTQTDISAKDDSTSAANLTYRIEGDPEAMMGELTVPNPPKDGEPITFTQQDLAAGKVSFTHKPPEGKEAERGHFDVVVTDEDGVETAVRTIVVIPGDKVLALADVQKAEPAKTKVVDKPDGADEGSVVLVNADELDEKAVIEASTDAQDAIKAAEAAPDDQSLKDAAEAAKTKAIADAKGKTQTVPKVGVWTVEDDAIFFTPAPSFAVKETTAQYSFAKGGALEPQAEVRVMVDGITDDTPPDPTINQTIDKTMRAVVPLYTDVMNAITKYMNTMPPSGAMAGIYTMVDNSRGVWKAPANVSVGSVTAPMVNIDHEEQENLNVSTTGKSINAIRPFVGEGVLVWGARTLDGNSLDWRYINVRRTMIMIEESIRLAAKAYVFEPNNANTWTTMRSMIENFLTQVWKAGGLAGTVPTDAFSVHVGLGETMTPVDILEGKLLMTVLVAVTRPAEFIEITFQQQMQKS